MARTKADTLAVHPNARKIFSPQAFVKLIAYHLVLTWVDGGLLLDLRKEKAKVRKVIHPDFCLLHFYFRLCIMPSFFLPHRHRARLRRWVEAEEDCSAVCWRRIRAP